MMPGVTSAKTIEPSSPSPPFLDSNRCLIQLIPYALYFFLRLSCTDFRAVAQTAAVTAPNHKPPCYQNASSAGSKTTIDCRYSADASDSTAKPEIALDHAVISFNANREGHMHIDLTFRNISKIPFTEARTVYIEFDDEAGQNYIRRPLPHVMLQGLAPGETKTFSDTFLAPALGPGRYLICLWIPSPDPALKLDSTHNFLLSNTSVPQRTTRLNEIAAVTVKR